MSGYESRPADLGIAIQFLPKPIANYAPAKNAGNLVFTAGQVSVASGVEHKGKLGISLSVADAQAATRACAINCLAAIKAAVGSLDRIKQIVAVHGLVNSTPESTDQAQAMNGASDLVVEIFGEAGRHIRTSAGVAALPQGFAASVYMIAEIA